MSDAWQRLGVFLELREDPEAEARRNAGRSRFGARVAKLLLHLALLLAAGVVFFCALTLVLDLVLGGDVSPRGVFVGGLRLFAGVWTVALVAFFVGRWVYWFVDRWV
jgi:hypothetical protein